MLWSIALRACWKNPPDNQFWYGVGPYDLTEKNEEWTDTSPIDPKALDVATALYLGRPWLQSNLLDWYILNGFVTDELFRFKESFMSGEALGEINWAYMFSYKKTIMSVLVWRMGWAVANFALTWLLLPALAAAAFYFRYILPAQLILGIFGIWRFFES